MTQYYVDEQGKYLGGFDGAEPPKDSIEIDAPPNDARDTWNGESWVPYQKTQPELAKEQSVDALLVEVNKAEMSDADLLLAIREAIKTGAIQLSK